MSEKITIELSNSDCVIIKDLLSEALPEELEEGNSDDVIKNRYQSLKNLRTAIEGAMEE
jgi:hypothetical protein|tara:strand:+ start:291 stop:467 length:177 start_codon:yes stop_codon:yes gene_type:complete